MEKELTEQIIAGEGTEAEAPYPREGIISEQRPVPK
jgi:hypothetical protein